MKYDELSPLSVPSCILAKKPARETEKELQQATEDLGKASHKVRNKDPGSDTGHESPLNGRSTWRFPGKNHGKSARNRGFHGSMHCTQCRFQSEDHRTIAGGFSSKPWQTFCPSWRQRQIFGKERSNYRRCHRCHRLKPLTVAKPLGKIHLTGTLQSCTRYWEGVLTMAGLGTRDLVSNRAQDIALKNALDLIWLDRASSSTLGVVKELEREEDHRNDWVSTVKECHQHQWPQFCAQRKAACSAAVLCCRRHVTLMGERFQRIFPGFTHDVPTSFPWFPMFFPSFA